jgi:hypothetical protein
MGDGLARAISLSILSTARARSDFPETRKHGWDTLHFCVCNLDLFAAHLLWAMLVLEVVSFVICGGAAQQIVGRERNQRACHRQLVRNVVVSRRVNSTVGHLRYGHTGLHNT